MTRIPVFTSTEIHSQISTFESFVFTFYLNERILTQIRHLEGKDNRRIFAVLVGNHALANK